MRWRGLSKEASDAPRVGVPLAQRLLEIKAGIAEYVRPESQAINERAVAEIAASGLADGILPVGAAAPEFTLPDQNGHIVRLRDLQAPGERSASAEVARAEREGEAAQRCGALKPTVISFFRGRWDPFCVTELEAWREMVPQLEANGVGLVAISPQTPKHNAFTADQHKLRYPVLSDAGNHVARQFGLVYAVSAEQKKLYKTVFINLPLTNGDESWELPLPATYVIGANSRVIYAKAFADYTQRPEIAEVLGVL
ncbi:MAG: peroxiredoxin family protein [Terriglobales bacterium]